jgi:hypothetical protein
MAGTGEPVQRIGDRPGGSPNSLGNAGRTERLLGVRCKFGKHQLDELPTAEPLLDIAGIGARRLGRGRFGDRAIGEQPWDGLI